MIALLILLASQPDIGIVQHSISYRLGIQALDAGPDVTTFANTLEGSVRFTDQFGLEGIAGGVYIKTDDIFAESRWRFGNPLLRGVYADTFGDTRLRASTGISLPLAGYSDEVDQGRVDRSGLASAAARSGTRDLWMWAPLATTWLTTVRIEQPIGILNLGIDAQVLLMLQGDPRFGGSLGGDVAIRPLQQLEIGFRVQGAGMATKGSGTRIVTICMADDPSFCEGFGGPPSAATERVLEGDRPNLSFAPWIATYLFDLFTIMARFTVNVSDTLGFEAYGGPFWGFDAAVGVAF